jgi:pSer/pThr/pTyr-binding forkhead associated (FHA) protein
MPPLLPKLVATDHHHVTREIPLTHFPIRLGRRHGADIQLGDRWASRDHCEIDWVDNALQIRDLGSKHGTYVNGRSVVVCQLHPGDAVDVGLSRFVVQFEPQAAGAAVALASR